MSATKRRKRISNVEKRVEFREESN